MTEKQQSTLQRDVTYALYTCSTPVVERIIRSAGHATTGSCCLCCHAVAILVLTNREVGCSQFVSSTRQLLTLSTQHTQCTCWCVKALSVHQPCSTLLTCRPHVCFALEWCSLWLTKITIRLTVWRSGFFNEVLQKEVKTFIDNNTPTEADLERRVYESSGLPEAPKLATAEEHPAAYNME